MGHDVLAGKLEVTLEEVQSAFTKIGEPGSSVSSVDLLSGGLLNSNFKVTLADSATLLRVYPEARSPDEIAFETEVLTALEGSTCRAPRVLAEGRVGQLKDRPFILLEFIEGRTLTEADIDIPLCADAGTLLGRFHAALSTTRPKTEKHRNDVKYIVELLEETKASLKSTESDKLTACADAVWKAVGGPNEWGPADGVVHGDYYVENLIQTPSGELVVIDFDDSYYGTTVFDLAIGAMEFAALDNQTLEPNQLSVFVNAYRASGGPAVCSPDELNNAMLINCLRFLCYTLPLTHRDGGTTEENAYFRRINVLLNADH